MFRFGVPPGYATSRTIVAPQGLLALERRQVERVTAVLRPEHAQQEAIHEEHDRSPGEAAKLLDLWVRNPWYLQREGDSREAEDTIHGSNDLCLQSELVLKATSEVADSSLAVARDVGNFADVVEHGTGGEEQDCDERDCSPQVAVLHNRKDVWGGDGEQGQDAERSRCDCNDAHVIDGACNLRLRSFREMS